MTVFQIWIGEVPDFISGLMAKTEEMSRAAGYDYTLIREHIYTDMHPAMSSDLQRLDILCGGCHRAYIDSDVLIHRLPDFDDNPLIGQRSYGVDTFLLYNGRYPEIIKTIRSKINTFPEKVLSGSFKLFASHYPITAYKENFDTWPRKMYHHFGWSFSAIQKKIANGGKISYIRDS